MNKFKYPNLFTPIRLGNTHFMNRLFAAPTGCLDLSHGGIPTPSAVAYYERKALGGAAAVTIGDCIVDTKTGQITAYQVCIDNPLALPQLSSMAGAISRHGAVASVELQHGGMYSHLVYEQGRPLLGPVDRLIPDEHAVNNDGHETAAAADGFRQIRAMTEEEILKLAEAFGKAAGFAKQCGFGMVMIHAAHGWGLAQFLSPHLNTRKDRWGGSFENRMRLPLAAVQSVRRYVGPGFPIEVRISGAECTETGYDIEEGVKIAKALDGHVDLIHVSAGHHESLHATAITHPSMFLPDGCNVKYAAEVKKHVKTPVATVGALTDPALMEEIVASGRADVVQIARGLLADPDLPMKARMGLDDDIDTCMRCYACLSNSTRTRRRACAINPEIGHEKESLNVIRLDKKKRVLIAGGGAAGMQAALTAARNGHEVILCEKNSELGGVLNCEKNVPFKARLGEYLKRQAARVYAAGVDVRLGAPVTEDVARGAAPDVVIAALGARPVRPDIPGINGANVQCAEDVYLNPGLAGGRVLILGGGLVGTELAVFLAGMGRDVTILELLPALNDGGNMVHFNALRIEIERLGIALALGTAAEEIGSTGVAGRNAEGRTFYAADTVIVAVGRKPLWDEADALRFCAPEFHQIGDCRAPRNILQATTEAYNAARFIGRL
jgi:2,4-dienoyl-CoA reductase-like NADH-dependent reductase (Old Yellow Enzyme family)/NADPH-dependent 2,4-dienoyl-CoA reductase/sulfur reductase-like enzyme